MRRARRFESPRYPTLIAASKPDHDHDHDHEI
jgi:hypothetical protein